MTDNTRTFARRSETFAGQENFVLAWAFAFEGILADRLEKISDNARKASPMTSSSSLRGDGFRRGGNKRIRVRDFMRTEGVVIDSQDDRLSLDDTLIEGEFLHRELRRGLCLHVGDVIEERAFTVTSHLKEGLSCIFFLDGEVGLKIGDRRFAFIGDQSGAIKGTAIMSANSESFRRESRRRQHVRHLVVSVTPEWLNLEGLEEVPEDCSLARLVKDHLAHHHWTLPPRVVELVRQFFMPSALTPALRNLYLEGHAVEIVVETITAMMQSDRRAPGSCILARQDTIRLLRAKDMIAARLTQPLSVEAIAREAGISASGLQRLFRVSEGKSIFEYVRRLRLERAFVALRAGGVSIQDASIIAGYSSPANFATAFRREFGTTPREVMLSRQ